MIRRALFVFVVGAAACLDQNDPARYAEKERDAAVDPDTLALPRQNKIWMLDPRNPLADGGRD